YALPDGQHLIFPKTLLRTREASRHVITVNVLGDEKGAISVEVSTPTQPTENRKIAAAGIPLTQERLAEQVRAKNPADVAQVAEELRSALNRSGLAARELPSTVQYGLNIN